MSSGTYSPAQAVELTGFSLDTLRPAVPPAGRLAFRRTCYLRFPLPAIASTLSLASLSPTPVTSR